VAFCINNSRKHGRVIMSLTEATPDHLLVSVRDSSKGLPASLQNDLFEPFAGDETVDNSVRNGGLGLAICHRLIRHMNGDLKLLSGDFSGCHFQLKIPLATNVTQENEADVTGTHAVFPLVNQHLFADKTILYIDNSADSITALTEYFGLFDGVTFEPAQETVLGLYKARSLRPDVIIIDLEMPGMDGHEMFSILQSDPGTSAIPVVALSNNDSPDVLRKSLDLGFRDYLLKPLDVEQLTMVISTLIAGAG
jgi:CheY-like chemotaxis protein